MPAAGSCGSADDIVVDGSSTVHGPRTRSPALSQRRESVDEGEQYTSVGIGEPSADARSTLTEHQRDRAQITELVAVRQLRSRVRIVGVRVSDGQVHHRGAVHLVHDPSREVDVRAGIVILLAVLCVRQGVRDVAQMRELHLVRTVS